MTRGQTSVLAVVGLAATAAIVLTTGQIVPVVVVGESMKPTFDSGPTLTACVDRPIDALEEGDIIAFERHNDVVVHRIVDIWPELFWTQGDNNPKMDGPVAPDTVLCRVEAAVDTYGVDLAWSP